MDIYIDADTGTYGIADELFVINVRDDSDIGDLLDSLSERDLRILAKAFGTKIMNILY